ncbi:MAG: hypothetical protein PHN59_05335 [Candidatus Omnitrophica bacterium]|nr:hypothetical protein [Candidatus Omnitrophota bacterium]
MKAKAAAVFGIIISFLLINVGLAFSQSTQTMTTTAEKAEPETEWLWGEVMSVDPITNEVKVKTLDYKNDTEIEVTVSVDDKTTYENIKSVEEIKPKDSLSIDYIVGPDGKNLAKNISLEKAEASDVQPVVSESAASDTMNAATSGIPDNLTPKTLTPSSASEENPKVDSSKN